MCALNHRVSVFFPTIAIIENWQFEGYGPGKIEIGFAKKVLYGIMSGSEIVLMIFFGAYKLSLNWFAE
jgi:hypothetical protein